MDRVVFIRPLNPVQPVNSPALLYSRLFASVQPGLDPAEAAAVLRRDKSVLDYIRGNLARLEARVPADQLAKLDSHFEGLRSVEKKLDLVTGQDPTQPPNAEDFQDLELNSTVDHERVIDAFFELVKSAFAFDLSRVVTFSFASGHNWASLNDFVPTLSQQGKIHEMTHRSYVGKDADMTKIAHWYGGKVVRLVQDLAGMTDLDGNTVLDNTLVVFFSEVMITGDGIAAQHAGDNAPLAIIGGRRATGHVGGRCLGYSDRSTNDFWATVQQRLGIDATSFGNSEHNSGGLSELF
ncbi:MAG: DUF1552 domain-containing protein [Nannocystaceae bacterium]